MARLSTVHARKVTSSVPSQGCTQTAGLVPSWDVPGGGLLSERDVFLPVSTLGSQCCPQTGGEGIARAGLPAAPVPSARASVHGAGRAGRPAARCAWSAGLAGGRGWCEGCVRAAVTGRCWSVHRPLAGPQHRSLDGLSTQVSPLLFSGPHFLPRHPVFYGGGLGVRCRSDAAGH